MLMPVPVSCPQSVIVFLKIDYAILVSAISSISYNE